MTAPELKIQILKIVETLKKAKKQRLAECIEKNWNKTAIAYSKRLNSYQPTRAMEQELLFAFDKELKRLGTADSLKQKILNSLEGRRTIQTAPHLGVTESPRMLCINWLGSLGVSEKDFYVVGMFSGVPFSNRSRPGRINKNVNSINLFPSNMQDGLVYRSVVTKKLIEFTNRLPEKLKKLLPRSALGDSYTKWALKGCANIEQKILRKRNLVYLDINEVVSEYLIQILKNKNHILYKIFFAPETRKEFNKTFPNETLFYSPIKEGKYEKIENITFSKLGNPENLIQELEKGRFCPALITGFLVLAFLNQFKCFGSFAQVEYLPIYQKKLAKLKFLKNLDILKIPTANLTTGVFPKDQNLFPVDIILGEKFKPNQNILFGKLLLAMQEVLLESYFTGGKRNNEKK